MDTNEYPRWMEYYHIITAGDRKNFGWPGNPRVTEKTASDQKTRDWPERFDKHYASTIITVDKHQRPYFASTISLSLLFALKLSRYNNY